MTQSMVRFGEVVTVERTAATSAESQYLPFVGLEHVESGAGDFTEWFRRRPETLLATKYRFGPEHVLYGKLRPNLNKVAAPDFAGVCTTEILPLAPHPAALDRAYLRGLLLSRPFVRWATGSVAGANLPRLDPDRLLEYEFRLPDLPEQRRLADQLAQADRLRRMRRYASELVGGLLATTFLRLFGVPDKNTGHWKRARIVDLGRVETGNTPPREQAANYGDAVEWIKSDNIDMNYLHPLRASESLSPRGLEIGRAVGAGSVLMTCIAGSETSIGNVALTNRRVAFNQQICAVTPREGVDSSFLYALLLTAKPFIQRNTTLAMKRMITKGKLEELLLIYPPFEKQQAFARIAEHVECLRCVHRESLRQANHLFSSLLARAFGD